MLLCKLFLTAHISDRKSQQIFFLNCVPVTQRYFMVTDRLKKCEVGQGWRSVGLFVIGGAKIYFSTPPSEYWGGQMQLSPPHICYWGGGGANEKFVMT